MRILIATGLYPPEIGGPATYTKMLEEHLPQTGIEVSVLPFSSVRALPKVIRHIVFFAKAVIMLRHADLIFAQDPMSVGLPSFFAARLLKKKIIIRMPGDYVWEQATQRWGVTDSIDDFQNKTYGWRIEMFRNIQKWVSQKADHVITPSAYFRSIVEGWGVPPEKIRVIYNGIHFNVVPRKPEVTPQAEHVLLSAGRLVPWKGFGMLIELLPRLPGWELVIIGEGSDRARLEGLVVENGVGDRVTFTGSLSREEVFGWYRTATAFALNTSFESFSFQVVEAMYSKIPVITTRIGSLPELIEDGREGALLEPNDADAFRVAIESTVREREEWNVRGEFSEAKSRKFSIETTVRSLTELLEQIV